MSELKTRYIDDTYAEYYNTGKHELAQIYLKSEADKVIEELKHQRDGAFGLANSGLTLDDLSQMAKKEIDRHKYKRCMAMAKWCFTKSNYHFVLARHGENGKENNRRSILYAKWHKRWLKIAAKIKEASND